MHAQDPLCLPYVMLMQVAVYSPADRLQPHRYKADEAYQVGTAKMAPVACYLDMDGASFSPGTQFTFYNFQHAYKQTLVLLGKS